MARVWLPYISEAEKRYLDQWWAEYDRKRRASPNWPPKWKPSKRKRRWKKK
jgi:hypothetical protein